ncbi:MAG: hypothetical protein ACFE7E_06820 [Candidatus Hodarchaeota archaeon]
MVDVEAISLFIAAMAVVFGVIIGLATIRSEAGTRRAQLFLEFHNKAYDKQFVKDLMEVNTSWTWKDAEEFFKKYGPETNPKAFALFVSVGSYFDGMGVLLRRRLIDVNVIPELMSSAIMDFWEKTKHMASEFGQLTRRPRTFDSIEYLYQEVRRRDEKRGLATYLD